MLFLKHQKKKTKWLNALTTQLDIVHSRSKTIAREESEHHLNGAAVWIPDHEVKACQVCSVKFTMINRRHHCRQCGGVVCGACTTHKKELPKQGKQRVCDYCFNDLEPPFKIQLNCQSPPNFSETDSTITLPSSHTEEQTEATDEEKALYELMALFDFSPNSHSESKKLPLKRGDRVTIYQTNPNGWWFGETNGKCGWVPANFLEQPKEYTLAQ